MAKFLKIFKNEDGATAIEYGLIAALIAVAAIGAMSAVGTPAEDDLQLGQHEPVDRQQLSCKRSTTRAAVPKGAAVFVCLFLINRTYFQRADGQRRATATEVGLGET